MPFPSTYKPSATLIREALDILEADEYPVPAQAGGWASFYIGQTPTRAAAIEMAKRELAELLELK